MTSLSRDVAIVGVGYSPLSRVGIPEPRSLTYAAVKEALDDAGLRGADVDGIFEYKFGPESPGSQDVARLIGSPDLAAFADIMASNPSGLGGALAGVMAVASGVCETVVVFRCITRESGYTGGISGTSAPVPGRDQFQTPYVGGAAVLVNMALKKRRWMVEYSRPEDDFGQIALNARRWSSLNPRAVLRDPLTMEDYLSSRTIVPPLRLLDCDYPINGAVATVITTAERAKDLRQVPVVIDTMTYADRAACGLAVRGQLSQRRHGGLCQTIVGSFLRHRVGHRRGRGLRRVYHGDDVLARGPRILRLRRVRGVGR